VFLQTLLTESKARYVPFDNV